MERNVHYSIPAERGRAIWSYKINHSSSPAVGATRQINRSSLLMSLLATSILPPTSIVHPSSLLFLSPLDTSRISRLLLSFRIHEINPLRVLWRGPAQGEASKRENRKDEGPKKVARTQCTAVYICCTVLTARGRLYWENASQSFDICTEMLKSHLLSCTKNI